MPGKDAFQVEGIVLEALSDRTCRVALSNGHVLLGFLTQRQRNELGAPLNGQSLVFKLSPYDISEGRIIGMDKKVIE